MVFIDGQDLLSVPAHPDYIRHEKPDDAANGHEENEPLALHISEDGH